MDDSIARVTTKKVEKIVYPVDKVNSVLWQHNQETGKRIEIDATANRNKYNSRKPTKSKNKKFSQRLITVVQLEFAEENGNGIKISQEINSFDKRVWSAAVNLQKSGMDIFSLTQVYYAMGGTSTPTNTQLTKIYESIEKMALTRYSLDNSKEAEAYTRYKKVVTVKDYLLPVKTITATINGIYTNSAIKMIEEPSLMKWADDRKQITTIPIECFQVPISMTEKSLKLQDYLLVRICRQKNQNKNKDLKILYKTFLKRIGQSETKQKRRILDKTEKCLKYYKKIGFIKSFEFEEDKIVIHMNKDD